MKTERVWAMPNKWTFTIKPIRELLEEEMVSGRKLSQANDKLDAFNAQFKEELS